MTTVINGSSPSITFSDSTTQASAGVVLQVVNATYSTETSSSSSTFADTGLTATITPKFSTSKILAIVNVASCGKQTNNTNLQLKLLRGSTSIADFERNGGFNAGTTANYIGSCSINYLDSPATTSATTYKVQFASSANAASVFMCSSAGSASTSTITLMEIAA